MSSRGNRNSIGGSNSLSYAAGKFKSKENEFTEAIGKITQSALFFADSLKVSGDYEKAILGSKVEEEEASRNYLTEQRNRLKALCAKSVLSTRYAQSFGLTASDVHMMIMNQSSRTQHESQNAEETTTNYELFMNGKMQEHLTHQEGNSIAVDDEPIVKKCRKALGEKESKKKSRQSSAEDDDDDDELEVMDSSNTGERLKCPITMKLLTNPVKSNICEHVYDEAAIRDYIRKSAGKALCPIPGCNRKISLDQLEKDPVTEIKVKRYLKKEEAAKRQRIEHSVNLEGDDFDNEFKDGGTTIIE
jgi:SUMO ligase MMS21 Smc5/6 complex component